MRVLVTRPRPDADDTAAALIARGHEPVVAPLLDVTFETGVDLDLTGVQAILVTSANGARALASASTRRDLAVFAVGDASAAAARQCGFEEILSAQGNVETLADLVKTSLDPQNGPLVHVAGTVIAGDLAGALSRAGFGVRREVLYRAEPAGTLPETVEKHLSEGSLDAALFYSPRTAAQFVSLVAARGLAEYCNRVVALALSDAVAEKLGAVEFSDTRIAEKPDQDSLFRALDATQA